MSRIFVHLAGQEVAPLLGVLNRAAREVIASEGDMEILGEELVHVCESLLEYDEFWQSAANEGDVFWDEGEAGDYVSELFTDSARRYSSTTDFAQNDSNDSQAFAIPMPQRVVVMLTIAYEGEVPELETDLASVDALKAGLKALINLHYRGTLRAVQIHFSPAQVGDELTADQVIENFPELVPL